MPPGNSICGAGCGRSVESAHCVGRGVSRGAAGVLLSSLAELARDYVQLRGAQEQLRIARDNLTTRSRACNLRSSARRAA